MIQHPQTTAGSICLAGSARASEGRRQNCSGLSPSPVLRSDSEAGWERVREAGVRALCPSCWRRQLFQRRGPHPGSRLGEAEASLRRSQVAHPVSSTGQALLPSCFAFGYAGRAKAIVSEGVAFFRRDDEKKNIGVNSFRSGDST